MFSQDQFFESTQRNLRAKDGQSLGLRYDPQVYNVIYPKANNIADSFQVNGVVYEHIFPQIGDIIVGISTDIYTLTNTEAICEVVETGYQNVGSLSDDDIKVKVLNPRSHIDFWVRSIFFRYATEEERRSVGR